MIRYLVNKIWPDSAASNLPLPPEWRLTPRANGGYMLERYHGDIDLYLATNVVKTKEQAQSVIRSLEQKHLYFNGEEGFE